MHEKGRYVVFARVAAVKLLAVLMLASCTYGPPIYTGAITSATLLGDGRVAIGFSQRIVRMPTGLAAFPDGGAARVLHDQFLVALVDRAGGTREIARFDDKALGGRPTQISWFEADPNHLYVTRRAALPRTSKLPLRRLADTYRIDLSGHEIARFDPARELAAQGRNFGAKGFGLRVVDAKGTMLVGATRDEVREVWRRDPDGSWTLLDRFDRMDRIVGKDVVYMLGNTQLARNWLTGDMRRVWRFNPATNQSEVLRPGDPALLYDADYQPDLRAGLRGQDILVLRDNEQVALIKPDLEVLNRR